MFESSSRWTFVACLMMIAGCGPASEVEEQAPTEVDTRSDPIWAQTPGAHDTTQELTWDGVVGSVASGYTLTSFAQSSLFGPVVQLNALYRDTNGCLRRVYQTELEAIWKYDPTLINCTYDPGLTSAPAAVSWGTNRIDVFWFIYGLFGGTAELRHAFWDGSTWRNESLGDTQFEPASAPVVGSWGVGHLDVLYRDTSGQVRRREFDRSKKGVIGFDANGWALSEQLIGSAPGEVSLAEPKTNELHVFYRSSSGTLARRYTTTNGTAWYTETTAIPIDGAPSATSWGSGRLDVVASRTISGVVQLKHIWREPGRSSWLEAHYTSSQGFGQPRAAAALGRPNRIDLLGTPNASNLWHALYQESLPGFAELYNPQTQYWCFANASGMVINYMNLPAAPLSTCTYVSSQFGLDCCVSPTPDDCLHGGDTGDMLQSFGVTWDDKRILTPDELRVELLLRHMPVIAHEDHNNDSGSHVVVIRDIYRIAGVDYVALVDPGNYGKTWVWPYNTFITYNGNWHVNYMYQGFHWQ